MTLYLTGELYTIFNNVMIKADLLTIRGEGKRKEDSREEREDRVL